MTRLRRRTLFALSALFLGSLAAACREPLPVGPPEIDVQPAVNFGSLDLSSILTYLQLPDLTQPRHTEAWIRAPEGGVLELGGVRVEVPAGALDRDTNITLDLPTDPVAALHLVVDLGPDGLTFAKPVVVRFDLTGTDLAGIDQTKLRVAWWDGSSWVGLASQISDDGGALLGFTTHFTGFGAETPSGG